MVLLRYVPDLYGFLSVSNQYLAVLVLSPQDKNKKRIMTQLWLFYLINVSSEFSRT